ncbi:sec1 family domain-containing protein 1 [Nematocida sp. AWRm80]|nr:sec1 family domain-containing protein 1 [Nematocida sp. AWRm80]
MLREKYIEGITQIISGVRFEWTVLILDRVGQNIIAPLFRMSDLMDLGIVQCLRIDEERERIDEARAIYLVDETEENTKIIIEDILQEKYREVEISFAGTLSRQLFERLAVEVGRAGESQRITRIMDGMTRVAVLHRSLYTLGIEDSFLRKGIFPEIETGLISIINKLDNPIIFCDPLYKGLATDVSKRAKQLGIKQKKRKKASALIILGREIDIITPIEHGWTYGALINEILEYDLNKVTIPQRIAVKKTGVPVSVDKTEGQEVFDLNRFDTFWNTNQNEYFPTAAERIEQELGEYKAELAQRSIDSTASKEILSAALSKVPELSQKNKLIHTHMTISLALVEEIRNQKIDEMVSLENDTTKISAIKDELEDILTRVSETHFLRLIIVLIKRFPDERQYLESLAKKKGCNQEILHFFVQGEGQYEPQTSIVTSAATSLLRNIKKILPRKNKLPITTKVEEVLNNNTTLLSVPISPEDHSSNTQYSSVHVFVIGGGTFTEYKALRDLSSELDIEISYGSTEILSPNKFISRTKAILAEKVPK